MINVNTYKNIFRQNSKSKIPNMRIQRKNYLNDSLKSKIINKNKIRYLIKNSEFFKKNNNKYQKTSFRILNQKSNTIKNNTYSIESTGLSKREKKV